MISNHHPAVAAGALSIGLVAMPAAAQQFDEDTAARFGAAYSRLHSMRHH